MFSGSGRLRVQTFLLPTLAVVSQNRYLQAITDFRTRLAHDGVDWERLTEEERDWYLAEFVLGHPRSKCNTLVAALARIDPRSKHKVAWRVLEIWNVKSPPTQAPAGTPSMFYAMASLAIVVGKLHVAGVILTCFAGLLSSSEALRLQWKDVIVGADIIVLVLGQTKSGQEQRVVLCNPGIVAFLRAYFALDRRHAGDKVFKTSYSTVLTWIKVLSSAFKLGHVNFTTHSMRRSAASELKRLGIPMDDLLEMGRWLTLRSEREYIRMSEVAILRATATTDPAIFACVERWAVFLTQIPPILQRFVGVEFIPHR